MTFSDHNQQQPAGVQVQVTSATPAPVLRIPVEPVEIAEFRMVNGVKQVRRRVVWVHKAGPPGDPQTFHDGTA